MNLHQPGPRSSLLAPLPSIRTDGRAGRIVRRLVVAGIVIFVLRACEFIRCPLSAPQAPASLQS